LSAKYIVGIDLGTTNSALAWCEPGAPDEESPIEICGIPQLINPNEMAERTLLPSFLYIPGELDFPKGGISLPWEPEPRFVVGELARKRGAESPNRVVVSAKSWLSYAGANRTSPILPWHASPEVHAVSPVEASSQFLLHLRNVWERTDSGKRRETALAEQDILLTVPASFDEEARELTRRASEQAGYQHVTLLEEPQAAFYAWLENQGDGWRSRIKVGDLVLVCDVGGGTTDFSLILVSEENGELTLQRVAVGDHILLGGDNMDLALARLLQQRLEGTGYRIDTWQMHGLWHQCRSAKEQLFESSKTKSRSITLLGKGTKLIGGTIKTELAREDLDQVLIEGFFPKVGASEWPARQRRVGFQELGLPYAADPAVTRHLARFLSEQVRDASDSVGIRRSRSGLACPTHVLFNGGVMKAAPLRNRVVEVLNNWLEQEGFSRLGAEQILDTPDLDHAVARGAAYYGRVRRGHGIRIRSGASRTYYIGIESSMPAVPGLEAPLKALCVVPFGMEEGTEAMISDREFGLVVGEPAAFRFLSSNIRKQDHTGSLLADWGTDLDELSPLEVTLTLNGDQGMVVPVRIETRITELGTLEIWCVSRDGTKRWKLEFNIREKIER
jgi:hypothetical protein